MSGEAMPPGRAQQAPLQNSGLARYGAAFNPYMPQTYTPRVYQPPPLAAQSMVGAFAPRPAPTPGLTDLGGGGGPNSPGGAGESPGGGPGSGGIGSGGLDSSTGPATGIGAPAGAIGAGLASLIGVPPSVTNALIGMVNSNVNASNIANAQNGTGVAVGNTPGTANGVDSPTAGAPGGVGSTAGIGGPSGVGVSGGMNGDPGTVGIGIGPGADGVSGDSGIGGIGADGNTGNAGEGVGTGGPADGDSGDGGGGGGGGGK